MLANKVKEQSWYQDVNTFVGFLFCRSATAAIIFIINFT